MVIVRANYEGVMERKQYIRVKHGTEGPRHDPYLYTELTFHRLNGDVIVCHTGLACWLTLNGKKVPARTISGDWDEPSNAVERAFQRLTGLKFRKAISIPSILTEKMLRAMPKAEREQTIACMEADEAMLRNAI